MIQNEIITKIKSGGHTELGMVYEEYRTEFLKWITREYECSDDDSKDIYQLTILIFYDNVRTGKLERLVSSVKTYLFGIGKNIVMENRRKANRQIPIDQERWLKEYLIDEPSDAIQEPFFEIVKSALNKLGDPCRKLVELFYYDRKSLEEISEQLSYKNPETAKNQKCKCMKRLRKLCEEEINKTSINWNHEYGK
jgi:RNA polymerase sigma-70 factor (ECF subfamily)